MTTPVSLLETAKSVSARIPRGRRPSMTLQAISRSFVEAAGAAGITSAESAPPIPPAPPGDDGLGLKPNAGAGGTPIDGLAGLGGLHPPGHRDEHGRLRRRSSAAQQLLQFAGPTANEDLTKRCVALERSQVFKLLKTNAETGLTSGEVDVRLKRDGRNELEKAPPTPFWKMIAEQFEDLLVLMLIAASLISALLGQFAEAVAIITIVLANATLGVVQESRAGAALEALESMSSPIARVLRDGKIIEVPSPELVVGDVIILETGSHVPADLRLIESSQMLCNEMALTGESEGAAKNALFVGSVDSKKPRESLTLPSAGPGTSSKPAADDQKEELNLNDVHRHDKEETKETTLTDPNMAYMGCSLLEGRGRGVVVCTGMKTKMGEIAKLLNEADDLQSPLQMKLEDLGVKLGMASLSVSIVVFLIGVVTGRGADPDSTQPIWLQMLLVAVSLTVAAVPEGLPACVTITLAVGLHHMVQKNALIRNLHSVETLGSASVICTDKTGTLTKGEMSAVRLWFGGDVYRITGEGYTPVGEIIPLDAEKVTDSVKAAAKATVRNLLFVAAVGSSTVNLEWKEEMKNGKLDARWVCTGNMSERPLVVAAQKIGVFRNKIAQRFPIVQENIFNSMRKMQSNLVKLAIHESDEDSCALFDGSEYVACVNGAPNVVLDRAVSIVDKSGDVRPLTQQDKDQITNVVDQMSSEALRVLAVSYRTFGGYPPDVSSAGLEQQLVFAGLVASIDPEREEVTPSIKKAANAGIRTVMITGDYVKTAKAIGVNVGILPRGSAENKAVDCEIIRNLGEQLDKVWADMVVADKNSRHLEIASLKGKEKDLQEAIDHITSVADVYARAKPVDKITIVRSLQRQGHVVAMTGDGVNDAPALKQANIGVAMGKTGTDVAKASADMVLTDDNFVSIVEAIEEGRTIYANIGKFVFYLLSTNVSEVFIIMIAVMIGLQSPLTPIQILWLNLVTDGAPAIALAVEVTEPGIMSEGPRLQSEPLIEKVMIVGIVAQTIVLTADLLLVYVVGLRWNTGSWDGKNLNMLPNALNRGVAAAQTMTIIAIVFAELFRAYTSRSLRQSVLAMGLWTNSWMQYAVGTSLVGTVFVCNIPTFMRIFGVVYLSIAQWIFVLFMACFPVLVDEAMKYVYRQVGFGERPKFATLAADAASAADETAAKKDN